MEVPILVEGERDLRFESFGRYIIKRWERNNLNKPNWLLSVSRLPAQECQQEGEYFFHIEQVCLIPVDIPTSLLFCQTINRRGVGYAPAVVIVSLNSLLLF